MNYKTITKPATAEIVEKKSRFIGVLYPCTTEQEAIELIDAKKKEHWNAAHNVSAFILRGSTATPIKRCSDDGEPQGTAGRPILEVLEKEGLTDVVCIVTRYFGGTLLGTGGLIRAYTDSTKAALAECQQVMMCLGSRLHVHTDYNTVGKILRELSLREIALEDSEYTDVIRLTVVIPVEQTDLFFHLITELSAGKSSVELAGETYFSTLVAR